MSDDLDRRLRERLQGVVLPSAPGSLRASLDAIVQTPPERTVRRDRRRTLRLLAVAAIVATAGLAVMTGGGSPPPDTALVATASPSVPFESTGPSLGPSTGPSPIPTQSLGTPGPTDASTPSLELLPAPLVRGSAREIGEGVLMAPGPDGTVFVSIPRPGGSVLVAVLDSTGRPRPGWPVALDGATSCGYALPVEDGSVRILCRPHELNQELNNGVRAFAFNSKGELVTGWPIDLDGWQSSARVIGDRLAVFVLQSLGDLPVEGQPSDNGLIVTIAVDGTVRSGTKVPIVGTCCGEQWAIGPDGVAYGVSHQFGDSAEAPKSSQLMAVSLAGVPAGFPIAIDGLASEPSFDVEGRIHVTVNDRPDRTARTLVLETNGRAIAGGSGDLGISASDECVAIEGSCEVPAAPLVGADGTTYVINACCDGTTVVGVSPSGRVMPGWPYRSAAGYQGIALCCPGDSDPSFKVAAPALGPGNVLYLLHGANEPSVGGSIVAVGFDGQVRPGWPVELTRPGAEFWSVVVGSDGTAFALAIEPEAGDTSSASILAIAPDSTVLNTTTIIEP